MSIEENSDRHQSRVSKFIRSVDEESLSHVERLGVPRGPIPSGMVTIDGVVSDHEVDWQAVFKINDI